jgi:hypothetical protein
VLSYLSRAMDQQGYIEYTVAVLSTSSPPTTTQTAPWAVLSSHTTNPTTPTEGTTLNVSVGMKKKHSNRRPRRRDEWC